MSEKRYNLLPYNLSSESRDSYISFTHSVSASIYANVSIHEQIILDFEHHAKAEIISRIGHREESDLDRYNLMRYNIKARPAQIRSFSHTAKAQFVAVVGGRVELPFIFSVHAVFNGSVELHMQMPFVHDPIAEVEQTAMMYLLLNKPQFAAAEILADIYASKDINIEQNHDADVMAKPHVGKHIWFKHGVESRINTKIHVGKKMPFLHKPDSFINGYVLMGMTRYATLNINVTIPPGGEIRIDSDVFTAMMGQQNILHLYNGDWIYFTRDTAQLVLDNATGGAMSGEVIYNARYI